MSMRQIWSSGYGSRIYRLSHSNLVSASGWMDWQQLLGPSTRKISSSIKIFPSILRIPTPAVTI
jgi:hypothetical protein